MHCLSTARETHVGVDMATRRGATSILRGQGTRHSEAMCMMCVSQNVSGHRIKSSNMMARQIPAFG
jgi:hypothetical protein